MKPIKLLLIAILIHFVSAGSSFAGYTYLDRSNLDKNNEQAEVSFLRGLVALDINNFVLIGKIETVEPKNNVTFSFDNDFNYFAVKAGEKTYFFESDLSIMSISAGDIYRLFSFDHAISHVTAWKYNIPPDNPHAPEPATLLLFGIGLMGFAGKMRKKKKHA